jgi:hypothetical protein
MRDVQKLKPNQLKVETYLLEATTGAMIDDLGFVILEAVDDTSAFRVISKTVTAPDNKDELVTFMPFEENDFLKGVIRSVTE